MATFQAINNSNYLLSFNFSTQKSKSFPYQSYLNHKSFYRNECFFFIKKGMSNLGISYLDFRKDNPKPQPRDNTANCGHILWHKQCGGCWVQKCWNKCVCFDMIEDPFRP